MMHRYMLFCMLLLLTSCTSHRERKPDAEPDAYDAAGDIGDADAHDAASDIDSADVSDTLSDAADADGGIDPLVDNTLPDWDWNAMVQAAADRSSLDAAFAAAGYTPPAGTYLFAAIARPGLQQLAFSFFSRGDDGFVWSSGVYWPASTVKVLAAVGAIRKLASVGCGVNATVSFSDDDGFYSGTVANLVDLAIRVSDNVAYNRLMEIGGFEEINHDLLHARFGMPRLVLQRRYTHPTPQSNLRNSPPISYIQGAISGTLPARTGTSVFPECPNEGNCITLAELLEGLRRVVFHEEIPASERFELGPAELQALHMALQTSPSQMGPGIEAALPGHALRIYNKEGQVYGDDRLDHAAVADDTTGKIYLLAASMPYNTTSQADMAELARQTIAALDAAAAQRVFLQKNEGGPIAVRTTYQGPGTVPGSVRMEIAIQAADADTIELFMDRWTLEAPQPSGQLFLLERDFSTSGERLLTVLARRAGQIVAVRHAVVRIGN